MISGKINIRVLFFSIIFFLVIINSIFFYQKKRINDIVSSFKTELQSTVNENYYLTNHLLNRLESKHLSDILKSDELIFDRSESENNLFIWVYFRSGCSICTEQVFLNMKKYSSRIGRKNVAVIVKNADRIYLKEEMITYGISDLRIITVSGNVLSDTIYKDENSSVFFVLDSCSNTNMIFNPDPNMPFLTERYFEKISEKYFTPE
jgi:hypothetical protein